MQPDMGHRNSGVHPAEAHLAGQTVHPAATWTTLTATQVIQPGDIRQIWGGIVHFISRL
jgi:hypothetical protein